MAGLMLWSLAATILLEEGYAFLYGCRSHREFALVFGVNCLTNPPVVFLFHVMEGLLGSTEHAGLWLTVVFIVLECLAVIVEWRCYGRFAKGIDRPLHFSMLANAFSCSAGLLWSLVRG